MRKKLKENHFGLPNAGQRMTALSKVEIRKAYREWKSFLVMREKAVLKNMGRHMENENDQE